LPACMCHACCSAQHLLWLQQTHQQRHKRNTVCMQALQCPPLPLRLTRCPVASALSCAISTSSTSMSRPWFGLVFCKTGAQHTSAMAGKRRGNSSRWLRAGMFVECTCSWNMLAQDRHGIPCLRTTGCRCVLPVAKHANLYQHPAVHAVIAAEMLGTCWRCCCA
jgi:hypothetical protein